jgi:hypothetical protein
VTPEEKETTVVPCFKYATDGEVLETATMSVGVIERLNAAGLGPYAIGSAQVGGYFDEDTLEVSPPQPPSELPPLDFRQRRAEAYPTVREFVEAFTERELGSPEKWHDYMRRVKHVKETVVEEGGPKANPRRKSRR